MGHDPTKQLLGVTQSSDKAGTTVYSSDPTEFPAGTAVRLGGDGLLTLIKDSNKWVGISLGKSLSDIKKTLVLRSGSRVPILVTDETATIGVNIGAAVYIEDVSGKATVNLMGATISNAIFVSAVLDGVAEDGTTKKVCLVDMVGGL